MVSPSQETASSSSAGLETAPSYETDTNLGDPTLPPPFIADNDGDTCEKQVSHFVPPLEASTAAESTSLSAAEGESTSISSVEVAPPQSTSAGALSLLSTSAEPVSPPSKSAEIVPPPSTSAEIMSPPSTSAEAVSPPSTSAEAESPPSTSAEIVPPPSTSAEAVPPPSTSSEAVSKAAFHQNQTSASAASGLVLKRQLGSIKVGGAARAIAKAKRTYSELLEFSATPIPVPMDKVVPRMTGSNAVDSFNEEMEAAMRESAQMANGQFGNRLAAEHTTHKPPTKILRLAMDLPMKSEDAGAKIMLTSEAAACSFCGVDLPIGEGVVLQDCFHPFCRTCIITAVEMSEEADVKCPMFHDCKGRILEPEIRYLLTPDKYEAYCRKSINQAFGSMQNVFHCKTKNCPGMCTYEEGSKVFLCPNCNQSNCLQCKAIHEGLECKQYNDLINASMQTGKSLKEAQEAIANNGWNQMVGTVAGWVATSGNIGNYRKSLDYSKFFQQLSRFDYLPNSQPFECPVCFDTIRPDGVIFQECFHMCCKTCCVALVQNSDDAQIKCPYQDGNYSCVHFLQPREIRALVSPQLYETHLARSVKLAENAMPNSFHCKMVDCLGWCEVVEGATVFPCQICGKQNCLKCDAIHEGISCEDFKNRQVHGKDEVLSEAAIENIIKKRKGMRCPHCTAVVMRISGCANMFCTLCRRGFIYNFNSNQTPIGGPRRYPGIGGPRRYPRIGGPRRYPGIGRNRIGGGRAPRPRRRIASPIGLVRIGGRGRGRGRIEDHARFGGQPGRR